MTSETLELYNSCNADGHGIDSPHEGGVVGVEERDRDGETLVRSKEGTEDDSEDDSNLNEVQRQVRKGPKEDQQRKVELGQRGATKA